MEVPSQQQDDQEVGARGVVGGVPPLAWGQGWVEVSLWGRLEAAKGLELLPALTERPVVMALSCFALWLQEADLRMISEQWRVASLPLAHPAVCLDHPACTTIGAQDHANGGGVVSR